jgi:hypothetical protein
MLLTAFFILFDAFLLLLLKQEKQKRRFLSKNNLNPAVVLLKAVHIVHKHVGRYKSVPTCTYSVGISTSLY